MSRNVFISYGTKSFSWTLDRLRREALATKWFDSCLILGSDYLPKTLSPRVREVLSQPRGGGYWIWKPLIIRQVAKTLRRDDILIYADAGCVVNSRGDFGRYRDLLFASPSGSLSFQMPFIEEQWTHQSVFDYFQIPTDSLIRTTGQLHATILLFRICPLSLELIDLVSRVAEEEPELFSDMEASPRQPKEFHEHRHDQSIWSVARKQQGTLTIPDETWHEDWSALDHVPIRRAVYEVRQYARVGCEK